MDPAKRSVAGMFLLLGLIAVWAIIVASFSGTIGQLWLPLQVLIYVAAGVAWIFPAKPIMRWIVTGKWRE
jgi:predicted membrane channel-forming protein YqfA (hemolysin III family)